MTANPQASWHNPRILLTLLLVFLCGSLAGALTMWYGVSSQFHNPPPYWTEGGKEISLHRFEKELDLTSEQAREIELILDDFVLYYHTLQAQMDEVRANGKSRILRVLKPEQKKKFGEILSALQDKQIR
jgi:Spy/CpxP family protein refolding chaperone